MPSSHPSPQKTEARVTSAQLACLRAVRDGEVYGHAVRGFAGFWWSWRGPTGMRRDVIERCVEKGLARHADHERSQLGYAPLSLTSWGLAALARGGTS